MAGGNSADDDRTTTNTSCRKKKQETGLLPTSADQLSYISHFLNHIKQEGAITSEMQARYIVASTDFLLPARLLLVSF